MPSNVISPNNDKHTVQQYRFKILHNGGSQSFDEMEEHRQASAAAVSPISPINILEAEKTLEDAIESTPPPQSPAVELAPSSTITAQMEAQSSFIEELLKKTDALSDNIIKLQMKIESQESEFKERLANETAKAKEEGLAEGQSLAKAEFDAKIAEIEGKYTGSIKKLNEECEKLNEFFEKTEKELSHTAIDIAKEVILKEVNENSGQVALNIAKTLIEDLKDATNIEIKVNPADLEYLNSNIKKLPNMKISSDDAIAKGGTLVLSNISNSDGTISARFEKIKKILSE